MKPFLPSPLDSVGRHAYTDVEKDALLKTRMINRYLEVNNVSPENEHIVRRNLAGKNAYEIAKDLHKEWLMRHPSRRSQMRSWNVAELAVKLIGLFVIIL